VPLEGSIASIRCKSCRIVVSVVGSGPVATWQRDRTGRRNGFAGRDAARTAVVYIAQSAHVARRPRTRVSREPCRWP
jgi:hypothetical protein